MAKDLRPGGLVTSRNRAVQAGFSMIEMLMTAFIMAVGILGLTALQVMSLKATRGSRSLGTATLVAEQVLDLAEREGRLTWLSLVDTNAVNPTVPAGLKYINLDAGASVVDTFNVKGVPVNAESSEVTETTTFFTATTTRLPPATAVRGGLSELTVLVQFVDDADTSGKGVTRVVRLTRMISHG